MLCERCSQRACAELLNGCCSMLMLYIRPNGHKSYLLWSQNRQSHVPLYFSNISSHIYRLFGIICLRSRKYGWLSDLIWWQRYSVGLGQFWWLPYGRTHASVSWLSLSAQESICIAPSLCNGKYFLWHCATCPKKQYQLLPLLSSQVVRICSHWHSTGSTHPNCNWTTKFRSQRTSHMELSATITTVTGPVGARLHTGTEDAPVLDRPAPLRPPHNSDAAYKYTTLLTYLISCYFAGERYYVFALWHKPSVCRL